MDTISMLSGLPFDFDRRIQTSTLILQQIKERQFEHGESNPGHFVLTESKYCIELLCGAGFLREIPITEGGLRFRITWKGLCFLDAVELYEQAIIELAAQQKENKVDPFASLRCFTAKVAVASLC